MGSIKFSVTGLQGMANDFGRLVSPEPYAEGNKALDAVLREGFEGTQQAVPIDGGDYRRPAGALRDSGRFHSDFADHVWNAEVSYGTNDDVMPYAVWARWKNVNKGKPDYMEPMEDVADQFNRAVNVPFDDVFGMTDL